MEAGTMPESMFVANFSREDTPWDEAMDALKLWIWENSVGCTLEAMEKQLNELLSDYLPMSEWIKLQTAG